MINRKIFYILCTSLLLILNACIKVKNTEKTKIVSLMENAKLKPENPYYSITDSSKLNISDNEWENILPKDLYLVARKANTERAFTGKFWDYEARGTYYCATCGNKLFRSDSKFSSQCGWPSFFEQENKNSVVFKLDKSYGMIRTEALCGRCDSHLGHLFNDGPEPTGKRYCMNSISLDFVPDASVDIDTITLGGGCYWCVEAIYADLKGVKNVASGFSGGKIKNPKYEEVCSGTTGHAEVVQITYDKSSIKLEEILKVFFTLHDPTTLNRQGGDIGTQYRSVIFYKNEFEKKEALSVISDLEKSHIYSNPIVTTLEPLIQFYVAEDYHQEYYKKNKNQPYCRIVIQPKVEKVKKVFTNLF